MLRIAPMLLSLFAQGKGVEGNLCADGETLIICDNAPSPDKGRPVAFEAKAGSGNILITFMRAKP